MDMRNIVHVDEKWFYMTKKARKYYLLSEEDDPMRTIQNKNSIGKVTVVARPRREAQGNVTFSGKTGVWAFVKEVPAARKSHNRSRGTLETKSIRPPPAEGATSPATWRREGASSSMSNSNL